VLSDTPSRRVPRLTRELGAFGVVGATAFLVDVGLFQVLYAVVGVDPVAAKLVSTLVATTVAYIGHRSWSFAHRVRTGIRRSFLLFAAVNTTTLLIGLGVVWFVRYPLGQESALVLQAANLTSIAMGTVIRFLAYKRWVFPAHSPATGPAVTTPPQLNSPVASRSAR
jgi:putative flippase GtrA